MDANAELISAAALVALLFRDENKVVPSKLRKFFERDLSPLEILETEGGAALVGHDVSDELATAMARIEEWASAGIQVVTPFSVDYPSQLRTVFDYPVLLFARGILQNDSRSVAIVGSREPSPYAWHFAADLAGLVSRDDVTVVSGLARGIDGSAHTAALRADRRTVAVLGNGLEYVYPKEHAAMQAEIAKRGLVLSQYLPQERPTRRSFPARNITMSAYSSITAIVEATEKSGTRIQADAAIKHGRPLVITRQVADQTSWGRKYSEGAYDVTVIDSPEDGRSQIDRILRRISHPALAMSA